MKTRHYVLISLVSGLVGAFLFGLISSFYFISNRKPLINFQKEQFNALPTNFIDYSKISSSTDFTQAASVAVPAVVHIKTQFMKRSYYDNFFSPFFDFFGQAIPKEYPVTGAGSGVIISSDGYIVTNNHVISEAEVIEVTLNDKREFEAKLIGRDPSTDIALLKIDATDLPFLTFGNSDELKIGEWVLAVGNPFNLTSTVTAGIVSAKARNINILGGGTSIESFIQTDAAVNKGNSGGALVNLAGELVGINTAIASNTGYYTGYSFAVPSKIVKKVVEDIIQFGKVQRAFMGVSIIEINAQVAREYGLDDVRGLYIAKVEPGSGADEAGLKEGDVILKINDKDVNSNAELLEIIANCRPGDKITVTYKSNKKEKTTTVTLKGLEGKTTPQRRTYDTEVYLLGAVFQPATKAELSKLKISHGIKVVRLEQGKLKQAGVREGFIITHIDNVPIRTLDDLQNALEKKSGGVLIEGVYPNGMRAFYGFGL